MLATPYKPAKFNVAEKERFSYAAAAKGAAVCSKFSGEIIKYERKYSS
jgi:hypothetical protein